jgi:hypothetical protein
MKKVLLLAAVVLGSSLSAMCWNCTGTNIRVQVPTGTVGTGTGDAPGNVVVDNGLTFECEPPATPTTPTASTSAANSSSTSGSSSNATGGNSKSTATGGSATVGPVSNTLTNTNTLGQKQQQTQSNSSVNNNQSAGGTASVSDVGNSQTTVEAPKIPVESAYAPTAFPTAPCQQGYSGGVQGAAAGISLGGNKTNKVCQMQELARGFALGGSRIAYCKEMVAAAKKADKHTTITYDDCMYQPAPKPVVITAPAPVPPVTVQPIQMTPPAPQIVILPVVYETLTVQATKAQVAAAKRPAHKKEPCEVINKTACLAVWPTGRPLCLPSAAPREK